MFLELFTLLKKDFVMLDIYFKASFSVSLVLVFVFLTGRYDE